MRLLQGRKYFFILCSSFRSTKYRGRVQRSHFSFQISSVMWPCDVGCGISGARIDE